MRTHGTLTRWNDDRGFGFITPAAQGERELFVHISAFPPGGGRPMVNELISFGIETGPDGRKRAVSIMRPGQQRTARPSHVTARCPPATRGQRERSGGRRFGAAVSMLLVVTLGLYGWSAYRARTETGGMAEDAAPMQLAAPAARYTCDGRTHCSHMTSCAEAKYFIRNCPNTQMDGDGDGDPCESQWCN